MLVSGLQHIGQGRQGIARLRVLKLHKNGVGDATCEKIAALIWHQKQAVEAQPNEVPCWVRLEHNQVSHAEYVLELLGKEPTRLRKCLAPRREKGPSCTSFRCQALQDVAHVHLYCIDKQGDTQSETKKHAQARKILQRAAEFT
ncbi:unnamed protein product [Symbiodinium pilosum]|uniref:Uncharacterized protein n=1 Tax=Symbiodinium pilosum TaxID=2952 RepID=A0A812WAT4_SYMPI|nr:unnamed protein product [Symbiodinium pilosum]